MIRDQSFLATGGGGGAGGRVGWDGGASEDFGCVTIKVTRSPTRLCSILVIQPHKQSISCYSLLNLV